MGSFGRMVAAAFRALGAALTSLWTVVWEGGKAVWRLVPSVKPHPPLPAVEPEPVPDDIAVGLRRWAQERSKGLIPRLPNGITSPQALWAMRLTRDEMRTVATASPTALREHLAGSRRLASVRPVLEVVEERARQQDDEMSVDRRALRAEMRERRMQRQKDWEATPEEPSSPWGMAL